MKIADSLRYMKPSINIDIIKQYDNVLWDAKREDSINIK